MGPQSKKQELDIPHVGPHVDNCHVIIVEQLDDLDLTWKFGDRFSFISKLKYCYWDCRMTSCWKVGTIFPYKTFEYNKIVKNLILFPTCRLCKQTQTQF